MRLHNESVEGGVALHWHGVDVPNAQDGVAGVTQDAVEPGEDHIYRWVAPDAGTYWYHSHQLSHEQVSGGLLGGIVIHPKDRERGVGDVVAMAHLYDEQSPRSTGDTGFRHVHGPSRGSGSASGWSTPTTVRRTPGPACRSWCAPSTGSTSTGRPTVTDRSVGIPAGGRADLEVRGAD